jgi:hypothetical protein
MRYFILSLFIACAGIVQAQSSKISKGTDLWDAILKANVTPGGVVDYKGIAENKDFKKAIELLASEAPTDKWEKNAAKAHWINLYNAFTVKLIVDNMPIASIKDIDEPWKKPFIANGDATYSLDQIEHEILRKNFTDPRIHFALNCASFSCPVLHNAAFRADGLDEKLTLLTQNFLNDINRNQISGPLANVSQIFEWYATDFDAEGGVRAFIAKYRGREIPESVKLKYIPYDWKLNGK